eukprot:CAMPEP_0197186244 /NCGR_PEP_ID=MMETSP1423-20130617/13524_1 /TAXON_ID=476441 /ORGANISM="Pseudo-nitzschia heimii, Strain UNC1101" /LENGTH=166 /DNA_ID=CAMNT_0042637499 /DNA_START=88 /DNA_END=585 /DNA_ORIENTATION=+
MIRGVERDGKATTKIEEEEEDELEEEIVREILREGRGDREERGEREEWNEQVGWHRKEGIFVGKQQHEQQQQQPRGRSRRDEDEEKALVDRRGADATGSDPARGETTRSDAGSTLVGGRYPSLRTGRQGHHASGPEFRGGPVGYQRHIGKTQIGSRSGMSAVSFRW